MTKLQESAELSKKESDSRAQTLRRSARGASPLSVHIDGLIYAKQSHGGISRNFSSLINAFSTRADIDASVYLPAGTERPAVVAARNWIWLPSPQRLRPERLFGRINDSNDARQLRDAWSRISDGIFHSSYYSAPDGLRIPQVLTMQDVIYEDYPEIFAADNHRRHVAEKQRALSLAQGVIFSSRFARESTESHYNLDDKLVLESPYAVDPIFATDPTANSVAEFHQEVCGGAKFLLHVGARYLHKNVNALLAAFSGWSRSEDFRLVLAGGGTLSPDDVSLLVGLGIRDKVVVLPRLDEEQLRLAYHATTALVFPSFSEGFGFPVLEALACGCPTACSAAASLPEVGREHAVYFDPLDGDDIRRALDDVVASQGDIDRWARAKTYARARTWAHVADDYVKFYGEVTK